MQFNCTLNKFNAYFYLTIALMVIEGCHRLLDVHFMLRFFNVSRVKFIPESETILGNRNLADISLVVCTR